MQSYDEEQMEAYLANFKSQTKAKIAKMSKSEREIIQKMDEIKALCEKHGFLLYTNIIFKKDICLNWVNFGKNYQKYLNEAGVNLQKINNFYVKHYPNTLKSFTHIFVYASAFLKCRIRAFCWYDGTEFIDTDRIFKKFGSAEGENNDEKE